jgi:hypothetical protein
MKSPANLTAKESEARQVVRTSRFIAGVSLVVFLGALIVIACLILLIVYIGGHDGSWTINVTLL